MATIERLRISSKTLNALTKAQIITSRRIGFGDRQKYVFRLEHVDRFADKFVTAGFLARKVSKSVLESSAVLLACPLTPAFSKNQFLTNIYRKCDLIEVGLR